MTDEEMAEEYANTVKCEWENDTYWVDCRDKVEDAFLAGLKAGRLKWHKVADGDLPKENRTVLDEAGDRFYYFRGHFYYESDSRYDCQPIAWCEIPQYTDKE